MPIKKDQILNSFAGGLRNRIWDFSQSMIILFTSRFRKLRMNDVMPEVSDSELIRRWFYVIVFGTSVSQ